MPLRCDIFLPENNVLIEAKSSYRRESIRMAIGQLLDLLADLAAVVTEPKMWSEEIVVRLAALRPGAYQAWADLEPGECLGQRLPRTIRVPIYPR